MGAITSAAQQDLPAGIVLVVDAHKKLIGTVTDGDIRKALVKGISMDERVEKIMAKNPITVSSALSVDEMIHVVESKVKDSGRIRGSKVNQVIVVDDDNQVVEVFDFFDLWHRQEGLRKDICIIGTGHVGLTLTVVLAELGFQVTGYDTNNGLIAEVNKGKVRFFEKGLEPLLRFHLNEKKIRFTTDIKDVKADTYIISVGTPVDDKTQKPINAHIEAAVRSLGSVLKKDDLVLLRSTVTVGTTRNIVKPILEEISGLKAGLDFYLGFAPERVVEGNAIEEMKSIPQIIGAINKRSLQEATRLLERISPSVILLNSLESAEMVKLINNTYRDYSFAFANNIAQLCDRLGLDTVRIINAANEGYPRNPVPLPSPGVGGYCLTKDPFLLAEVVKNNGVNPDMFIQARRMNESMPDFVASKIGKFIEEHFAKAAKIKIYILGIAFKGYPETSDIRGSSAIDVMNALNAIYGNRLKWCGYDPVVNEKVVASLGVEFMHYEEGFKEAHGVLIMNNHPNFKKMDIFSCLEMMHKPGLLFDGWRFFSGDDIERIKGVTYQGLGGRN